MPSKRSARRQSFKQRSRNRFGAFFFAPAALCLPLLAHAQLNKAPDITKVPTLYVVDYAHLDTQWRWEMPQTISEYLLKTLKVNFDYIDKYPHYVFNWTGSNRYRLMKEYYPDDYARMTRYVAQGRWFPAGSSVEEGDINLPSAEGIFRQVLYGNTYFRNDFGIASNEYMLPDCFGFPASLPSILNHAGVRGFSTQKLNATWQPAPKVGGPDSPEKTPEGIPFNVGVWIGPDGSRILAALNPSSYNSNVYVDLSKDNDPIPVARLSTEELRTRSATITDPQQKVALFARNQEPDWPRRIELDGKVTGVFADFHYVGVGDMGGATQESSVKLLEAIATKGETVLPIPPRPRNAPADMPTQQPGPPVRVGEGPVHVIESAADQMFHDITPALSTRMPTYQGDLELINHSAGSLTSEAYHKRWVIENEMLADDAEKASIAAEWLGARPYPHQRLTDAWTLALGGHFHDTAAGTATPRTYEYAWNDDIITANQFADVFTSGSEAVASALDTQSAGTPVVVFNPLNIAREDLVEAAVPVTGTSVQVKGPDGEVSPAQIVDGKVLFLAKAPSVGYAVYAVQPASTRPAASALKVTPNSLENARYKLQINPAGDVSSIFDKSLNKELLAAPIRMVFSHDDPKQYPAWNMDFDQEQARPVAYVDGPAQIRIKESGPIRVAMEVTRQAQGSKFVQTISLSAGDAGNRVEFANQIDWRSKTVNLKVAFPLTATNPDATYNEDVGTIQRPNANDRQFEVLSHRWIDLTDKSGTFGTTILTDDKNGSDKPNDNTIRLTLLRTPGTSGAPNYSDQANQDWGHHEFSFGLVGHANGWRDSQTDWQAYRLNDPLTVFTATPHPGPLGKSFSLLHLNNPRVRVFAVKKAEHGDETIVRFVELDGKPANGVRLSFASPIAAAREVNAQELPLDPALPIASLDHGTLVTSLAGYEPKTFALKLTAPTAKAAAITSQPVALTYTLATASNDDTPTAGPGMDGKGDAYPAEMLPSEIHFNGVDFQLAKAATGTPNAIIPAGQSIPLPAGSFNHVYLLAASISGDQHAEFRVGSAPTTLNIENWGGFIGQWDTRLWKPEVAPRNWATSAHPTWPPTDMAEREFRRPSPKYPDDYLGLREGYVKPAALAWYASHFHTPQGLNQPYQYSYLFAYSIPVPPNAHTLTLPKNDNIRILAISVANESPTLTPAHPLFDTLQHAEPPTTEEHAQALSN
jgi:alpha-mannosidase